jgi:hypothetical protein
LALRVEGDRWNAYAASLTTMEGSIFLGSVPIAAAQRSPEISQRFMELMQLVVEDALGNVIGWSDPASAPESERSGSA